MVFHELSHSVIAKYYRIPVDSITLVCFGRTVADFARPTKPVQEFNIAIAGPLSEPFSRGLLSGWLRITFTATN